MEKIPEQRQATRYQIEVPISYDRGLGITRDISLSGVYFITDQQLTQGDTLRMFLKLRYSIPGMSLDLDCRGEIVRIETQDGHFGVAATIDEITYLH